MQKPRVIWIATAFLLAGLGLIAPARSVQADPVCDFGSNSAGCKEQVKTCTTDCKDDAAGNMRSSCTPGQNFSDQSVSRLISYGANRQGCIGGTARVDTCTGVAVDTSYNSNAIGDAEMCFRESNTATLEPVCDTISFSGGRLVCESSCFGFDISASVSFPGFCIDVTPYPVTLVNYDTAIRNSCMGTASGTGRIDYIGRGRDNRPEPGDMRNIRFTLSLVPYNGNAQGVAPPTGSAD